MVRGGDEVLQEVWGVHAGEEGEGAPRGRVEEAQEDLEAVPEGFPIPEPTWRGGRRRPARGQQMPWSLPRYLIKFLNEKGVIFALILVFFYSVLNAGISAMDVTSNGFYVTFWMKKVQLLIVSLFFFPCLGKRLPSYQLLASNCESGRNAGRGGKRISWYPLDSLYLILF